MSATPQEISLEPFLALPDDGVYREVHRGRLREFHERSVLHDKWHSKTEARIAHLLLDWLHQHPQKTGEVHSGEVGCAIQHDPLTTVGIDVAYFDYDVANDDSSGLSLVNGPPILAVEILSLSDTVEGLSEKVEVYLALGFALVWFVDPRSQTIEVFNSDVEPHHFNIHQTLIAEPFLPGFTILGRNIFE